MTRNEPPRRQLISTRTMLGIGIALVVFGVIMIVFFPNVK